MNCDECAKASMFCWKRPQGIHQTEKIYAGKALLFFATNKRHKIKAGAVCRLRDEIAQDFSPTATRFIGHRHTAAFIQYGSGTICNNQYRHDDAQKVTTDPCYIFYTPTPTYSHEASLLIFVDFNRISMAVGCS